MAGHDVAVVGAGIAGLTAAHELRRAGRSPLVLEAGGRVGGRQLSVHRNGFIFDVGQYLYLGGYSAAVALMAEVGLTPVRTLIDATLTAGDGRLHTIDPRRPLQAAGTRYLSTPAKLRAGRLGVLVARETRKLRYEDSSSGAVQDGESVADYFRRELSEELLDTVARPIVTSLGANDPEVAPMAQLLWTLKAIKTPHVYGLPGGNDALSIALARGRDVVLDCEVSDVTERDGGVEVTSPRGTERFAAAVLALQPHRVLPVYAQLDAGRRAFLESADTLVNVGVHLGLSRPPAVDTLVAIGSFRDNPDLSGCVADHRKCADRAPAGKAQLTAFASDAWARANIDRSDEQLLPEFLRMLRPVYGDLSDLIEDVEFDRWPHAGPRVAQGRFRAARDYERAIDPRARVQLAGDFHSTGLLEAALRSGRAAAQRIIANT